MGSYAQIMLILCLFIYLGKELFTMKTYKSIGFIKYLKRVGTYRNIAIIISITLVTFNGFPRPKGKTKKVEPVFLRWQYHVASFTCLLVWVEMAAFFSKIPLFGKYCHMFR